MIPRLMNICKNNLAALDFPKMMMRTRVVEELSKSDAEMNEPGPVQITQDDALFGFALCCLDQSHLRVEVTPGLTVVDQSIDPRPKLWIHRFGEFGLPPEIKWEIGIELGKNNTGQQLYFCTFEQE